MVGIQIPTVNWMVLEFEYQKLGSPLCESRFKSQIWISYRNVVCVCRVFELQCSVEVVDEMEAPDVDPPDAEVVNLAVDDGDKVDRVKAEWDDQGGVTQAQPLLKIKITFWKCLFTNYQSLLFI